jgi:hypothetical protein
LYKELELIEVNHDCPSTGTKCPWRSYCLRCGANFK